jgi:hypothetical protein
VGKIGQASAKAFGFIEDLPVLQKTWKKGPGSAKRRFYGMDKAAGVLQEDAGTLLAGKA